MTIDPRSLRREAHGKIAAVLRQDVGILIERWSQRAVQDQPQARRVHAEVLRDHFATLLDELARGLAERDANGRPHVGPAVEHGIQRWQTGWSLAEVVRDFQILRLIVLEHLEDSLDRSLTFHETLAVGLALDEAIEASVIAYVQYRDDHNRKVEDERAERQRQANETRRRWQHIFEHAGLGLALTNPTNDVLQEVNPAFAAMYGYAPEELVGCPMADLYASEARGERAAQVGLAKEKGNLVWEAIHLRKDGSRFPALTHLSVCKDEAGAIIYQASAVEDITERKRLEESLRVQAEALKLADRRKDVFLATLAHELRNPLAPILHSVEVLRLLEPRDQAVCQARAIVERQVKQMSRIVDDLLDLTRISQGKLQLRPERTDVAGLVAQAIQTSKPLLESRLHELSVALPAEPLWVEVDAVRFVQVLCNLLNNAAKYTKPGGKVWLRGEREGEEVVIRVRDSGIGIPADMLGRIFELFTQGDERSDHAQGGLGIGLTLVRKLVELHGGKVTASSPGPGQGSEFVVRVPAAAALPSMGCPAAPAQPLTAPPRRILIVEDNSDGRETLQTLLGLLGHQVAAAADGPQGVDLALEFRPEVALIDIGLPTLDGYQVAQRVRAALGNDVFLIALTGYGQEDDRRRAREAGFNAHLVKPVEIEELSRLLASLPQVQG